MIRRILALASLALLSAAATGVLAAPAPWSPKSAPPPAATPRDSAGVPIKGKPKRNILYINGLPDTAGVFLPETTVLARVDDRRITAREFVDSYYNAYAPDRPNPDSAGRAEWLNSMVNKEVLGRVARKADPPFTFEDRLQLRQHRQRVLSNVLYMRAVLDSVSIREEDVRALTPQFRVEHHLRRLSFLDAVTAERVRSDLVAKRIRWEEAALRYRLPEDDAKADGDLGWRGRSGMSFEMAAAVYSIKPGEISRVVEDPSGTFIFQSLEERSAPALDPDALLKQIVNQARERQIQERIDRLQGVLRREIGMQYDSANIVFASSRFEASVGPEMDEHATMTIHINESVPVFAPSDTSRVLARYEGGQITLGGFLQGYSEITPFRRPAVNTFEAFRRQLDSFTLEPFKARLAEKRGLQNDSLAVALIEKERERIMVDHMYRDSIESKITISPKERRKYYQSHLGQFYSFQTARYATLAADDSAGAAALAGRLLKGESAEAILRADSIAGREKSGAIHEERENEHSLFHGVVFGALKPGQFQIIGPGKNGVYGVVQLLSMDQGRQLSFEESDAFVSETLQNNAAEALLEKFLARHKKRFRIETHPEMVGRIRLVDPSVGVN